MLMKYLNFKLLFFLAALALAIPPAWAGTVTDVINRDVTISYVGGTNNSSWVADFSVTGASGAEYTIHSMGNGNSPYYAIRWNTNGYLYATKSGGKLVSVTIKGYDSLNKKVNILASNSAYSSPTGGYLTQLNIPSENTNPGSVTYNF